MKKRSGMSRCYDRQFNIFAEEYPWLKQMVSRLSLNLGHLHNLTEETLSRTQLEESIGLVAHPKRGESTVKVYVLNCHGDILARVYPTHAFAQSLAVLFMRMLGYDKYRAHWTLREGVRAFIEMRRCADYQTIDVTDDVRHLLVVTEWAVKYRDVTQDCLEIRILNIEARTLATIERQTRLRAV